MANPAAEHIRVAGRIAAAVANWGDPMDESSIFDDVDEDVELRAHDLYAANIPLSGWLDNFAAAQEIRRRQDYCNKMRIDYQGRTEASYFNIPEEPENPDLASYMRELQRGKKSIDDEGLVGHAADVADEALVEGEVPLAGFDMVDEQAPAVGPARAERAQRPRRRMTFEDDVKLRAVLLETKHMVEEGVANARRNHVKTRAIADDDLVLGMEDRADSQGRTIRLEGYQREAIGRIEHSLRLRRGVILADEMGLGKTPTIVAVIQRAVNNAAPGMSPLIVICVPASLLDNWTSELGRAPDLRVYHMADDEALDARTIRRRFDVVLVSQQKLGRRYGALLLKYRHWQAVAEGREVELRDLLTERNKKVAWQGDAKREEEATSSLEANGLIVDEAHAIRNQATALARALNAFKASSGIAVTGTPLQNGVTDLGGLFTFLNLPPFNLPSLFRACFSSKKNSGKLKKKTRALNRQNNAILASIRSCVTIRRQQDGYYEGDKILESVGYDSHRWNCRLSDSAQDYQQMTQDMWDAKYKADLEDERREDRDAAEARHPKRTDLAQALLEINLCRMHVLHPDLIHAKYGDYGVEDVHEAQPGDLAGYDVNPIEALEPGVGDPEVANAVPQPRPEDRAADLNEKVRKKLNRRRMRFLERFFNDKTLWQSDRFYAVVEELIKLYDQRVAEAARLPSIWQRRKYLAEHKILVYCEFLSALDILEIGLQHMRPDIKVLRFDGHVTKNQRQAAKSAFEEVGKHWERYNDESPVQDLPMNDEASIMFVTNRAGPSWNPTIEDQIICRAARKGQKNNVRLHRFYSELSIEGRVVSIQRVKRYYVDMILDDSFVLRHSEALLNATDDSWIEKIGYNRVKAAFERGDILL
ncbi:hypothetical protein CBER1_04258 [Cercospora berteroae]|uniref:Helicase ATP-binding domain-containing protein n=1 Tax=Cercospora berteroae TaxID=357750 RepID=A0A2S6C6B3_9PEZI|nr:hypothetical protein CBER1_04258 [Cercospora berteroae]